MVGTDTRGVVSDSVVGTDTRGVVSDSVVGTDTGVMVSDSVEEVMNTEEASTIEGLTLDVNNTIEE